MNLLVFAHRGEAQYFFDHWMLSPVDFIFEGLYKSDHYKHYLLITGEGRTHAGEKTAATLAILNHEIERVINLGLAGSLNPRLKKGELYWVRTAYAEEEFKSYSPKNFPMSLKPKIDCISAKTRLKTTEDRTQLSHFADLVDRELWAVSSAAHLFKKETYSLKLISDDFESLDTFCVDVKDEAPTYSKILFNEYRKCLDIFEKNITPDTNLFLQKIIDHPRFYFTLTQSRQLNEAYNLLKTKNFNDEDFLNLVEAITSEEDHEKIRPKDLSRLLLSELQERLNPLRNAIFKDHQNILSPLYRAGIKVSFDKQFESSDLNLSLTIKSNEDVTSAISALNEFDYQKLKILFNGNIDHV